MTEKTNEEKAIDLAFKLAKLSKKSLPYLRGTRLRKETMATLTDMIPILKAIEAESKKPRKRREELTKHDDDRQDSKRNSLLQREALLLGVGT
jgi:hypothetical protein